MKYNNPRHSVCVFQLLNKKGNENFISIISKCYCTIYRKKVETITIKYFTVKLIMYVRVGFICTPRSVQVSKPDFCPIWSFPKSDKKRRRGAGVLAFHDWNTAQDLHHAADWLHIKIQRDSHCSVGLSIAELIMTWPCALAIWIMEESF